MSYTSEHVAALRDCVKRAKTLSERERARALLALAKGKKRAEIAEIFEITVDTLNTWQTNFKRLGINGIANKGYPGNHYKLTKEQKAQTKQRITEKDPKALGLSKKRFWTTKLLKKLIQQDYGISYESEASYRKLFYSFGFSCHKPGKHNRNQRQKEVERFRVKAKKRSDNTGGWAVWYW